MFKKFLGDSNVQTYLVNNEVEAVSQPKHGRKKLSLMVIELSASQLPS